MSGFARELPGQAIRSQRQIKELTACVAAKMCMKRLFCVKTVSAPGRFQSLGLTLVYQDIQIPVNRPEADPRMVGFNGQVDILCRRMGSRNLEKVQNTRPDTAFSVMRNCSGIDNADLLTLNNIYYTPLTSGVNYKNYSYNDNMATLYVVATPIGNLEDITYRAVRILGETEIIAAEDTRQTRKLLNRYDIRPRSLISCRARNEEVSSRGIVKLLEEGRDVAYVSDAGTPGVSDPGSRLAAAVREAGFSVVPLPGASAVTTLVSVAGTVGKGFVFEGFLSPKGGRRRNRLKELMETGMIFVLYESPYRIIKLLEDLKDLAPERKILIGREITKKFEEFLSGTAEEVLAVLSSRSNLKGEFAVLVGIGKKG